MKLCISIAHPHKAGWDLRPIRKLFLLFPLFQVLLVPLLLLASCATPRLDVWSNPMDASIHMDGKPAGLAPMSLEPHYYGTVLIHGEEQVAETDITVRREAFFGAKARKVDFSAPVSRWLFGIDLVGEALVRLFGNMDAQVDILLPLIQDVPLVDPDSGRALEHLIDESEAASLAR